MKVACSINTNRPTYPRTNCQFHCNLSISMFQGTNTCIIVTPAKAGWQKMCDRLQHRSDLYRSTCLCRWHKNCRSDLVHKLGKYVWRFQNTSFQLHLQGYKKRVCKWNCLTFIVKVNKLWMNSWELVMTVRQLPECSMYCMCRNMWSNLSKYFLHIIQCQKSTTWNTAL